MKYRAVFLLLPVGLVAGCVPYKYHAAPISAPALAQSLETRNLDDPELHSWMQGSAHFHPPSWPLKVWNLNSLTLAAYYFNPDLDIARANAAAASAAITTAAMKPNPTVGIGPGYQSPPDNQFIMGFNFDLPIETAGKRGYRTAGATHLSEASRLQLAATAWMVRSRVRSAFVDYLFAEQSVELLRKQEVLEEEYPSLIEKQVHAGEVALPEETTAQISLTHLRQMLRAAEGQVNTARVALAAVIGIPDAALADKQLEWNGIDDLSAPASLPAQSIREEAVVNRVDVRRALEQYEAAQSNLQLEAAKQYPDIHLGPGYNYEEGAHFIALNLSAVLPLRNHNQGPIAEAEAERKAAGAQLLATQSVVIAESDKALAQYRAAYATLDEASQAVTQLEKQQQTAEQMLRAGETDRLSTVAEELQNVIAERARLDAQHQAQLALGMLEDALQHPLDTATISAFPKNAPR